MKNPYRRRDAYGVRGWLAGVGMALGVLQLVMLGLISNTMTTPGPVPGMGKMALGCLGLAVVLLANGVGIYWVTSGWETLWEKWWKVMAAAAANLGFAVVYWAVELFGWGLWGGLVEQFAGMTIAVLVLADLIGTGVAVMKLREK